MAPRWTPSTDDNSLECASSIEAEAYLAAGNRVSWATAGRVSYGLCTYLDSEHNLSVTQTPAMKRLGCRWVVVLVLLRQMLRLFIYTTVATWYSERGHPCPLHNALLLTSASSEKCARMNRE